MRHQHDIPRLAPVERGQIFTHPLGERRVAAFGGTLTLSSPPGGPTALAARVPLLLGDGAPGGGVSPGAGRGEDR